jgi:predicted TIM-barrel fold metal-dependent hydrolase
MDDLRNGRLEINPYYHQVDLPFYREHLEEFLPGKIIDIHAHVTGPGELLEDAPEPAFWAERICPSGMSLANLLQSYLLMFPGKSVTPVVFPMPSVRLDPERGNAYAAQESASLGLPALMLTDPRWPVDELEERAARGGFRGLKPYPVMAPARSPDEVEIYDYLPREHLDLADQLGWLVILHIPRSERLADPVNLKQLQEIDQEYPNANVVVAHVGRAYCARYGRSLAALGGTENILFDISANCNQTVFETLLDTFPADRIVFGSDMPITAMHARRFCEGDNYVNIVMGAEWEDDHTRKGGPDEGITFFLYESIAAFMRAAQTRNLSRGEIERVFCRNAERILMREVPG